MHTLSALTWIGNAAAVLFGHHGDITQQTQQAGCSRQVAYQHAHRVQQAVADAQRPGPAYAQLRQDNEQLRQENQQLWEALDAGIDFPLAKQRQFTTTAAAMGLSLAQILALLAIVLPPTRCPSRAHLGRWVRQAAQQARRVLKVLDEACRPLVVCLCLDEIFFRRQPVLMGVEPHSLAWVLAERAPDRSGPTWAKALAAWPGVRDVAADGGSGLKLGLELAAAKRQEDAAKANRQAPAAGRVPAPAVPLHVRLDVFHIRREGERALRLEWAQAEARWEEAEQADRAKARYDRTGQDRRHFKKDVTGKAWAVAAAALESAQRYEAAWQRAVAALAVFRPDGQLNDRAWATAELRAAAAQLPGQRWAKVRRMLLDERTLTFLDRLHEELAAVEPCPERRQGLVALWRWRRERSAATASPPLGAELEALVCRQLGEGWQQALARVSAVLARVVRASSAVECVNSVVRMHQARHRKLTQELLDLKRLYWNGRSFVSGKRKGRCPYEHLGLKLPTCDPWQLLQMDPAKLKQQLSTPKLRE
jgi:hypothetical protein